MSDTITHRDEFSDNIIKMYKAHNYKISGLEGQAAKDGWDAGIADLYQQLGFNIDTDIVFVMKRLEDALKYYSRSDLVMRDLGVNESEIEIGSLASEALAYLDRLRAGSKMRREVCRGR